MGGKSTGTFTVKDNYGVMDGEIVNVPSLKAPGFIKASANGKFADFSEYIEGELVLKVRSTTPEYKGYRVSMAYGNINAAYSCSGGGTIPFSRGCYKAKFSVPEGSEFTEVRIPFKDFSDKWSPATGEHVKDCTNEDKDVCMKADGLKGIKRIELWAEGVAGKVHLEVESISAQMDDKKLLLLQQDNQQPPKNFNYCSAKVQENLKYGISGRMDTFGGDSANESMAESVCCDSRNNKKAEPQFVYAAPDINLYAEMEKNGVTTFYDSVCGVPLFRAPVGRTLQEFQEDTDEHGWPSFRSEEVLTENVITDEKTKDVKSVCGTHLGAYLPDDNGPRWCMDLSCIAGNEKKLKALNFLTIE